MYKIEVLSPAGVWTDAQAPHYPSMSEALIRADLFYPLHITRAVPVRLH